MIGTLIGVPLATSRSYSCFNVSLSYSKWLKIYSALWAGSSRRTFVLAWLSVYAYVGAPVLLAVLAVHVVIVRLWEDSWPWRQGAAGLGGLAAGYLLNPFWPGQWVHTARELSGGLAGYFGDAGRFIGYEWLSPSGDLVLRFAFFYLLIWSVLLVRGLNGDRRVPAGAVAGT